MSFQAMAWAVKQKTPDPHSKLLLLMLANHSGRHETDHDVCWPSMRLLAEECCMSEDTVQRRVEVLSSKGLLSFQKRSAQDGRNTSNLYHLPVPDSYYGVAPAGSGYPTRQQRDTPPPAAGETYNTNLSLNLGTHTKSRGSLEECKDFCTKIELPESDGEWFFHKCEGNGWTNNKQPIKDWKATIRAWKSAGYMASQRRDCHITSGGIVKPAVKRSVYELSKIIEAKQKLADDLKRKWSSEVAGGRQWTLDEGRREFVQISKEIKELNSKLASM